MKNNNSRLIGAHVSMAGGLDKAVKRAASINCNCMQIFSGSPRSWQRSLPTQDELNKLFSIQKELSVSSIFTHALYLVNLASPKPDLLQKSINSLIHDLHFDSLVKGSGVVVHLGSHLGKGWDSIKKQLLVTLQEILKNSPANSTLLIENSAGQKGKIASNLEEISWLLEKLNSSRVGWCVDSCHAFAAGYPLVKKSQYASEHSSDLITEISRLGIKDALKCIHVNDSKVKFNAGNDRHDNIGEGEIPQTDFKQFLQSELCQRIPLITEVPGFDGKGPDLENIKRLKSLAGVG